MTSRRDSLLAGLALAAVATATVALLGGELPDHATKTGTQASAAFEVWGCDQGGHCRPVATLSSANETATITPPDALVAVVPLHGRLPVETSQFIKRALLPPGLRMSDVELDHCRPLCLGGSNERANLQLQPWPEARLKDEDERFYCAAVGRGEMPRDIAAGLLARRWPCGGR